MKRMGIEALYRRPRTTKPEPGHKIYPYLLRGMEITWPNQVWAMDITYIPMTRGFVYLAVVLDWFSRRVLSWRVSITMEAAFCVETLQEALCGTPSLVVAFSASCTAGRPFAVIEWSVWDGLSNLRITYPSSTSRLRAARSWVVADRVIVPFELSK
jgi:putative transposase